MELKFYYLTIKVSLTLIIIFAFSTNILAQNISDYLPEWESPSGYCKVPKWFRKAKIEIYTHWGVYKIPAHNNQKKYKTMNNNESYNKHGIFQKPTVFNYPLYKFDYQNFTFHI